MNPKPGWQTTEFYVALLTTLAPILAVVFHRDVTSDFQVWGEVAAAAATIVYTVSRSFVKHTTITKAANNPDPVV